MNQSQHPTVGILTLPLSINYGGIFQAYALCHYLKTQGVNAQLLNRQINPDSFMKRWLRSALKNIPFQNVRNIRQEARKAQQLRAFIQRYLPITPPLNSSAELRHYIEQAGLSTLIVGSDQVWRYQYTHPCWRDYFLAFTEGSREKTCQEGGQIKKVAYAASFGIDQWQDDRSSAEVSNLMQEFSALSVRESSGADYCRMLLERTESAHEHQQSPTVNQKKAEPVEHVMDPTLLIRADQYRQLYKLQNDITTPRKTIYGVLVTYLLDNQHEADHLTEAYTLHREKPNEVHHLADKKHHSQYYTPEDWLRSLDNAAFVITDSFHGMVFSVIFRKPFAVIVNQKRGKTRFTDFLQMIGLEERIINDPHAIPSRVFSEIDYNDAFSKLNIGVRRSKAFLHRSVISSTTNSHTAIKSFAESS